MALSGSGSSQLPRNRAGLLLLIVIITGFGAALRFRGLGNASLWLDEAVTWAQSNSGIVEAIIRTSRDTYPPGYNVATALAVGLFGESEWALRLPAAIFGTLAIPVIFWIGGLAAGRAAGVIAALMAAASTYAIYYSQEARMYSLLMLAAALLLASTLAYVARPGWPRAIGIALSGALLLYSQPYGAFSWLSIGAAGAVLLLLQRAARPFWLYVAANAVAFVLFVPWLSITLSVASGMEQNGFWIPRPGWLTPLAGLAQISGSWLQLVFVAAGWALSIPFWLGRSRLASDDKPAPIRRATAANLLLAAAFGPWAIGLAVSLLLFPIFVPRYLIGCLPALLVLSAIGFATLFDAGRKRAIAATAILFIWLVAAAASDAHTAKNGEDSRALAAYLRAEMRAEDCLLVREQFSIPTLQYYLRDAWPACELGALDTADLRAALPAASKLYLVSLRALPGVIDGIRESLRGEWSQRRSFGSAISLTVRAADEP